MHGAIPPISHMPSWLELRKIYAFTLAQTQLEM